MNGQKKQWEEDAGRVRAEISAEALRHNITQIHERIGGAALCAVIKADAYGHGAVRIAQLYETYEEVAAYAVATASEAFALRDAGIRKPIHLLGYTTPDTFERIILEHIRPVVFRRDTLQAYADAVKTLHENGDLKEEEALHIHIAADCGMHRIGITPDEEGRDFVREAVHTKGIHVEGIFTHFSRADERNLSCAQEELHRFQAFTDSLHNLFPDGMPLLHVSNSASVMTLPEAQFDMVRAGIILYGLYPSDEMDRALLPLRPVLSLKSKVVLVKEVAAGQPVSYGGTFVTDRPTVLATVSAGYADGVPRTLSNRGEVLIRGQRARIAGRVCMDQFMVDVTDIEGVREGDDVTLIGRDGAEEISLEEVAGVSGRFHYELPCLIPSRVPRILV